MHSAPQSKARGLVCTKTLAGQVLFLIAISKTAAFGPDHIPRSHALKRFLKFASLGLLIALLGLYLGDAAVLQTRLQRGSGYRVIPVNQFLATPLKGQKEEYDVVATIPVTCVRSIFPQRGFDACWWVERHTAQWQ